VLEDDGSELQSNGDYLDNLNYNQLDVGVGSRTLSSYRSGDTESGFDFNHSSDERH